MPVIKLRVDLNEFEEKEVVEVVEMDDDPFLVYQTKTSEAPTTEAYTKVKKILEIDIIYLKAKEIVTKSVNQLRIKHKDMR